MSKKNNKKQTTLGIVAIELILAILIVFLYFFASSAIQNHKYDEISKQHISKTKPNKRSNQNLKTDNQKLDKLTSDPDAVSILDNLKNGDWTIYWQSKNNSSQMKVIRKFTLNDYKTCHINGKDYPYKINLKQKKITIKLDNKNNKKSNLVLKNFQLNTSKENSYMMKVFWDGAKSNGTCEKA